jgi:hypothetical protein
LIKECYHAFWMQLWNVNRKLNARQQGHAQIITT